VISEFRNTIKRRKMLRTASKLLLNVTSRASGTTSVRSLSHYPIDDEMFGLNSEQIAVSKKL
jgi:hypothetical protein